MKRIALLALFSCAFLFAFAGDKSKSRKVYKGHEGVEIYEILTDTSNHFVVSYPDKSSDVYSYSVSVRLDSFELKKLAVNFNEIMKPEYVKGTYGTISASFVVEKCEKEVAFMTGYGIMYMDFKFVSDFSNTILTYLGETSSSQYQDIIVVKNEKLKKVYEDVDKSIRIYEVASDTSSYFSLRVKNQQYGTGFRFFSLDTTQLKNLAEVCWKLTDAKYGNGASAKLTETLVVQKRDMRYLIGNNDGYSMLLRLQAINLTNAIRKHFGEEPVIMRQ